MARRLIFIVCSALAAAAQAACAWGPATHAAHYEHVLAQAPKTPEARRMASEIRENTAAFVYGSIFPDIRLSKGPAQAELHKLTHNPAFGLALLKAADTPPRRAFAAGTLLHFTADNAAQMLYAPSKVAELRLQWARRKPHQAEALVESITELNFGDRELLTRALGEDHADLVDFYFTTAAASGMKVSREAFQQSVREFHRYLNKDYRLLALLTARANRTLGLDKAAGGDPKARATYEDSRTYFALGAAALWDVLEKKNISKWCRWPVWTQTAYSHPAYWSALQPNRPWSSSHGIGIFEGVWHDGNGKQIKHALAGQPVTLTVHVHALKPDVPLAGVALWALTQEGTLARLAHEELPRLKLDSPEIRVVKLTLTPPRDARLLVPMAANMLVHYGPKAVTEAAALVAEDPPPLALAVR